MVSPTPHPGLRFVRWHGLLPVPGLSGLVDAGIRPRNATPRAGQFRGYAGPVRQLHPGRSSARLPDHLVHFKEHHIADLHRPFDEIVSKSRRRKAERALRKVDVEWAAHPLRLLDEWIGLFELMVEKFRITGIRAFSREAFTRHLALPGVFMSLARYEGAVIAADTYMVHGEVAYAHLAGANDIAYKVGARSALYYSAVQYFADKARWIDWGGDAGLANDGRLTSFKSGWSTGTRPVYFCGRIFDRERYDEIARVKQVGPTGYFPAYREGEYG